MFVVGSVLGVRVGTVLLTIANQERAKAGLPNNQVHETGRTITCAVTALKILIEKDKAGR